MQAKCQTGHMFTTNAERSEKWKARRKSARRRGVTECRYAAREMRNKWIKKIKAAVGWEQREREVGGFWEGGVVLRMMESTVGIRLSLWGCDQTLKPPQTSWKPPNFKNCLPLHIDRSVAIFSALSCLSFFCVWRLSLSFLLCLLCLQLPSPTAMSTALRGISCYLREVNILCLCLGFTPSFCLSDSTTTSNFSFD